MLEALVWYLAAEWVGGAVGAAAIAAMFLSARYVLHRRPAVRKRG